MVNQALRVEARFDNRLRRLKSLCEREKNTDQNSEFYEKTVLKIEFGFKIMLWNYYFLNIIILTPWRREVVHFDPPIFQPFWDIEVRVIFQTSGKGFTSRGQHSFLKVVQMEHVQ